jgi:hypothetical protein
MANEELENNDKQENSSELELVEVDEAEKIEDNEDSEQILVDNDEDKDQDTKKYEIQKKLSKIQKILIGVVAFLFIIITIGATLYFMGYFDPPPQPVQKIKKTQMIKKDNKYHFKASDIDSKRLNRKLSLLTKYELVLPEEEKAKKQKKEKIVKTQPVVEKKEEIIQKQTPVKDMKENKPEEKTVTKSDINKDTQTKQNTKKPLEKDIAEDKKDQEKKDNTKLQDKIIKKHPKVQKVLYTGEEFLKFIQVATLKYKLYKSFLNQVKAIDARISICSYKGNKTQIFIGPFNEDEKRDLLVKKINNSVVNDAFKIEFTKEEFNKRCNF